MEKEVKKSKKILALEEDLAKKVKREKAAKIAGIPWIFGFVATASLFISMIPFSEGMPRIALGLVILGVCCMIIPISWNAIIEAKFEASQEEILELAQEKLQKAEKDLESIPRWEKDQIKKSKESIQEEYASWKEKLTLEIRDLKLVTEEKKP